MSETTKRIEDYQAKIVDILQSNFGNSHSGIAYIIATHLHQEVIRGKIEELEKCPCSRVTTEEIDWDRDKILAHLQRQIKE